ncbi:MAG: hypothetical protein GWN58_33225 [Anaerolineae bacterium]|nr:sensor histidine kinase [Thermoplasmata archaeon]NIV34138.1 hypothetical protein [Anaerolineae bacterium]NIY05989.1 hypothetical protein [Thermoplasmata archaeon]
MTKPKLEVDPQGLAKLIEKKGKAWVIFELLQNGIDEPGVTEVTMHLEPLANRPVARLIVEDDSPEGFRNLAHAYTLFAESYKKDNPVQRGIWNLGEKLVLALCNKAEISTTKGTIIFEGNTRRETRTKRERGTRFTAEVRMTRKELEQVEREVRRVIPPEGIKVTFNGRVLERPPVDHTFKATLPTRTADEEGNVISTRRLTDIELFDVDEFDPAEPWIYEMGIPVCPLEGGERWSVNVGQKVPLNMQRDNVTGAYLRTLRVLVLNEMHENLEKEDAAQPWAVEAADDKRCSSEAITTSLDLQYGKKRVIYDPSDPEGTKLAVSKGYSVIHGGAHSKGTWDNIREAEAALPAGQVTPSPTAYAANGSKSAEVVPESKWTKEQRQAIGYIRSIGEALLGYAPDVLIVKVPRFQFAAAWCDGGELHLNLNNLGHQWFKDIVWGELDQANSLLIHEFAHDEESDHLSKAYHRACCDLGAKLARLALDSPHLFKVS